MCKNAVQTEPDFVADQVGSIFLLTPLNSEARKWIDESLPNAMQYGGGIVIEHRYWPDIYEALTVEGFILL